MNGSEIITMEKLLRDFEKNPSSDQLLQGIYDIWIKHVGDPEQYSLQVLRNILVRDGRLHTAFFFASLALYADKAWFKLGKAKVLEAMVNLDYARIRSELLLAAAF